MTAELNFVRQQGLRAASPQSCVYHYPALMWQPRAIGILVVVGLWFQAWSYFLALGALLWWNVAWPDLNPFDALYTHLVANPKGLPRLGPAPSPRRFAQAMAGTFMLAIGLSLFFGWRTLAWGLGAFLLTALAALIFGRFCLGSYLFFVFTGQAGFANRTLPWARNELRPSASGNGEEPSNNRLQPPASGAYGVKSQGTCARPAERER